MARPEVSVCLLAILIPLAFINCQDPTDLPFLGTRPTPPDSEFGGGDREHDDRLFFANFGSAFGSVSTAPCNYTTQPGRSCLSCRELLSCGVNNTGTITTCHGWFRPYCNSGFCSLWPETACSNTTSTTSPSTG